MAFFVLLNMGIGRMSQISAAAQCFSELFILALTSFVFWTAAAPKIKVWTAKWSLVEHPKGIMIQSGLGLSVSVLNIIVGHLLVILLLGMVYQRPSPSFDFLHAGLTNNIGVNLLCYFILSFHFLKKNGKPPFFLMADNSVLEQCQIKVSKNGSIFLLEPREIIYIETANNCVILHTKKGKFVKYQSLKSLTSKLCSKTFKRVHRSYLVNVNYVESIRKIDNGDGLITLSTGTDIRFSRTFAKELPIP